MLHRLACALSALALLVPGCTGSRGDGTPEDGFFVDDGKEDDYLSYSAREYVLEGKTTVVIEEDLADNADSTKERRVKELIGYKQIAIAWFLTQYLVEKEEKEPNHEFGGFGGIAKAGAFEDLKVHALDDRTYEFTFRQIVAGSRSLMSDLPIRTSGGQQVFDLEIGRPSNDDMARLETNAEWYRDEPWSAWDPSKVGADQKEKITFSIERETESEDAWFDVDRLIDDGVLDIDVHMGWDYHSAYHVKHSRAMFDWLEEQGFDAPVSSFDRLNRTSGPFTRRMTANGKDLEVEVRLFYGKTGTDTDPDTDAGGIVLERDVRKSLRERDVIVYSGHSGPFYGFALANWKKTSEGDLDDDDIRTATMPEDRYQVVLAEGCDTYQIGQAFKDNPAKQGKNIDVITSTSFSDASSPASVENFISALIERDDDDRMRPRTVKSLLTNLDDVSYGFKPMYGIHGIDDNPMLHPFAVRSRIGKTCSANADCGGIGHLCVKTGQGSAKACTAACSADPGCPSGYACASVASSSSGAIYAKACRRQ